MKSKRLAIHHTMYPLDYDKNNRRYDDKAFRAHIQTELMLLRVKANCEQILDRWETRMKSIIADLTK